jgi:hypothetical protein
MTLNAPSYNRRPIGSVVALARALNTTAAHLEVVTARADSLYRLAQVIRKPDGRERRVYQALEPLNSLQLRILQTLLKPVDYPNYLMGGISDPTGIRGYVRNAQRHAGSAVLISEDASEFFPSITRSQVIGIFQHAFHFPPGVAALLSRLCTRDGELPQGASPSTYLANLVLHRKEPQVVASLEQGGFRYGRFVDDILVSSPQTVSPEDLQRAVSQVRGLLEQEGFRPNRRKQEIKSRGQRRTAHNLNVDGPRATVPKAERKNIRAAVVQLERRALAGSEAAFDKDLRRTVGRVSCLHALHPQQAATLKLRLSTLVAKASLRA